MRPLMRDAARKREKVISLEPVPRAAVKLGVATFDPITERSIV